MYIWKPNKNIRLKEVTQNRKVLYLLDKQTINLWRNDKAERFGLGIISGEDLTRFVYAAFPALNFLSLAVEMTSTLQGQGTFHMGELSPAFR